MEVGGCRGDLTAREDGQVRIVMMRKNIYVYRIKKKSVVLMDYQSEDYIMYNGQVNIQQG